MNDLTPKKFPDDEVLVMYDLFFYANTDSFQNGAHTDRAGI